MSSTFPSFALGVVLGGVATWFFFPSAHFPFSGDRQSAVSTPETSVSLPAWSWRDSATPPLLARNSATAAIDAWLALRGPDGAPPDFATRASSLRALLARLPADAFPHLLNALARTASTAEDRLLRDVAFDGWLVGDAPAAARWAVASGTDPEHRQLARKAVQDWARADALAASTWACSLADSEAARQLAGIALRALAKEDSTQALALARSRDEEFHRSVMGAILETLGKADPAGTLRTYGPELWNNGKGFHSLRSTLAAWVKQDPAAALGWLVAQPRRNERELASWLANFGDNSAQWRRTVAETIATAPGITGRGAALQDLLFRWSSESPDEAVAWLDSLADPDLRVTLIDRASNTFYSNEPQKSLPLALAMPEGARRTERLAQLLGQWARIDPDATLAWMRENEVPGVAEASHAVHGALLADIARDDPRLAVAEWSALSDPRTRLATIHLIANSWATTDPAAALHWAVAQNEQLHPAQLPWNYTQLVSRWAATDATNALRWVEDLITRQPEQSRPQLAQHYFDAIGGTWDTKAPRAATAELFTTIKDPSLRTAAITRHVQEWLTKDPAAARAWLETNSALTPEQAATLLAEIE